MGCIPFILCTKYIKPLTLACSALVFNVIKAIMSIVSLFAIIWAIIAIATVFGFLELVFLITNIVNLSIIIHKIKNKEAFNKSNAMVKILCIITLIISGLILLFKLLSLIMIIVLTSEAGGFWVSFIITYVLNFLIELIHFVFVYYLFRLLQLRADCSYDEYEKNGNKLEQNSTSTKVNIIQNQQIFNGNTPNNDIAIQVPQTNVPNNKMG